MSHGNMMLLNRIGKIVQFVRYGARLGQILAVEMIYIPIHRFKTLLKRHLSKRELEMLPLVVNPVLHRLMLWREMCSL